MKVHRHAKIVELIRKYEELERCVQKYSDEKFREIFQSGTLMVNTDGGNEL